MSSHASIAIVRSIFKKGAFDFLEKPVNTIDLLDAVKNALILAEERKKIQFSKAKLNEKLDCLTRRENQILDLLVEGKENSEISKLLNISIRTVETHRNKVLKKMGYSSLPKLIVSTLPREKR